MSGCAAGRAMEYARDHRRRSLEELKEFIRFPSVSAQPKHGRDVKRCAEWLATHLRRCGLTAVRVIATRRHPLVYAEWRRRRTGPTLLIYGHYDVQPAEPLAVWKSPPFAPTVRGGDLYGRGACDDKGQMFTHVKAMEACLRSSGELPLNVKCIFEGEEEIGSPNLIPFVEANRAALAADMAVISDTQVLAPTVPPSTTRSAVRSPWSWKSGAPAAICIPGFSGAPFTTRFKPCARSSPHSTTPPGTLPFPVSTRACATPSAGSGTILPALGRAMPACSGMRRPASRGANPRYTLYERTTLRPALTVNGIRGGYQGPGGKGIIPAFATVKLSFRLVPDQDPAEVDRLFRAHIARVTPPAVRVSIRTLAAAKPALVDRDHPAMRAASDAYEKGFGNPPVFLRSGGTIPVVDTFQRVLGIPTVLMGFGLPDDGIHAPQ